MARRRRSYVYRINLRVFYERQRIRIPFLYAMPFGIAARLLLATAHHGFHPRAFYLGKRRSALLFSDLATAYKSPLYYFHNKY